MTTSKQSVKRPKPDNDKEGPKRQVGTSSDNRKPTTPKAQVKSTTAKSTAKASVSPTRSGGSVSTLKANATRAEALEHENVAVQNKKASDFNTNTTEVSGVIVPSGPGEIKATEPASALVLEQEEKPHHKKDKDKHSSKDKKAHLLATNTQTDQVKEHDKTDPRQQLDTLQKKAIKSEKKVKKLKKKVHKAEKKDIKPSKIRALKEKLTKAFSKWQRRKKRVEEAREPGS